MHSQCKGENVVLNDDDVPKDVERHHDPEFHGEGSVSDLTGVGLEVMQTKCHVTVDRVSQAQSASCWLA